MHPNNMKHSSLRTAVIGTLVILPSVALGMLAMISSGVPALYWGQQAAAFLFFPLLALIPARALHKLPRAACSAVLTVILAVSLLGPVAGGARRWLDLGPLNVNAAMLVLPALLILLGEMAHPYPALLCAAAALSFQPDLSQLAGLIAASLPILWQKKNDQRLSAAVLLVLAALAVRCALAPTTLEPVAYSDGILLMLGGMSPLLAAAGWLSLALIPAFFLYRFRKTGGVWLLSLALYYAILVLFVFTGDYPVAFLGFGLSPIAGYWLAHPFMSAAEISASR